VKPHLTWLQKAIAEGVKVEGYFYWTLMDNYEWNHGVKVYRMGLYDVDNGTKEFSLSPMGQGYGKAAQANGF
jgi:beta-glucosidase